MVSEWPQANEERGGPWLRAADSSPGEPTANTETMNMTPRRKTSSRLTLGALSLAAALALQTGPAVAQSPYHDPPVEEEIIDGRPDRDANGNWTWCWPLYWFFYCWTR